MENEQLVSESDIKIRSVCQKVLEDNWRTSHTIPAENLYPHQWLWDSCFIAIGLRHIDTAKAQQEIRSLIRGQWSNGMLPHMIFADDGPASKDRRIWQAWRNPHAHDEVNTSGMTQPPMLAEAVVKISEKLPESEKRKWYQDMYPSLLSHHEWLYRERDPHNEGLVSLIHPWESGLDNSPPWINQLHMRSRSWWVTVVEKLKLDRLILLVRRDTHHVPPGQRLNSIDALLYYTVLQRLRRKNWDTEAILERSHFMVEDLAFNSILLRANKHLQDIAQIAGKKLPEEMIENVNRSELAIEKLWDGYYKQYFSRSFITHKLIKEPSISTLLPLYSGVITQERAEELVDMLHDKKLFDTPFPVASVPLESSYYKELGYWQGPSWINTNWLIADGLRRYGFDEEADHIVKQSIEMVEKNGPYEYFSAKNGDPAGAKNFSWTAALIIDFLQ
jgi:hypothetical protein